MALSVSGLFALCCSAVSMSVFPWMHSWNNVHMALATYMIDQSPFHYEHSLIPLVHYHPPRWYKIHLTLSPKVYPQYLLALHSYPLSVSQPHTYSPYRDQSSL